MNTEQIMALADARAQAVVEASKLYAISILSSRTQDAWDKADEARNSLQAAVEELMQERDALRLVERGMEMTINDLKESRDTYQREADKLAMENKTLRDALEQALPYMESESVINGYGYYRPGNPHNFHPDHEMCSESEIANHKAACTAYDAGNYCDDYDDGWLSPNLHVTKAPWGIGSYNEPIPELEAQCKQARAALKGANHE